MDGIRQDSIVSIEEEDDYYRKRQCSAKLCERANLETTWLAWEERRRAKRDGDGGKRTILRVIMVRRLTTNTLRHLRRWS
jgi:hypothetical protein